MKMHRALVAAGLLTAMLCTMPAIGQSKQQRREEADAAKYYSKWLNQDVLYIISDEERDVFSQLSTPDEMDQFIEQFWQRRDIDPNTAFNEYKEEHYRRIAYANAHFGSGIPGWKTDRGRVLIMFGEPDAKEYNPGGGTVIRKPWEGGGRTNTFPYEIWTFNFIDGVGDDVEIEFVDRSMTGEFKMAIYPWEKDMLLHVDGVGETTAEKLGLSNRAYRPGLHPGLMNNLNHMRKTMGVRAKDMPFERMLRFFALQKPPEIRRKELRQVVVSRVSYSVLPVLAHISHFWINPERALVPITIEVPNKSLEYVPLEGTRIYKARVAVYGRVTSINGNLVAEFERSLASEYPEKALMQARALNSVFQKVVAVSPGRYKIELVIKDLNSGNLGTLETAMHVAGLSDEGLSGSPIVLATELDPLERFPEKPTSFVIGDVRVVPAVGGRFESGSQMGVYCQLHNAGLDQSSLEPSFDIEYEITRSGKLQSRDRDRSGSSIHFASGRRVVLLRKIDLYGFKDGRYQLTIRAKDNLSGQSIELNSSFQVFQPAVPSKTGD